MRQRYVKRQGIKYDKKSSQFTLDCVSVKSGQVQILVLNSIIVQKQIERDAGVLIINHWLVDQVKGTLIPILLLAIQRQIMETVDKSFSDREQSKHLLDIAKRGMEMAIEKSEKDAQNWIKAELKLNIRLD